MIEFEKMHASTAENSHNLGVHRIIQISLVLRNTYVIFMEQDSILFYLNNYID